LIIKYPKEVLEDIIFGPDHSNIEEKTKIRETNQEKRTRV